MKLIITIIYVLWIVALTTWAASIGYHIGLHSPYLFWFFIDMFLMSTVVFVTIVPIFIYKRILNETN